MDSIGDSGCGSGVLRPGNRHGGARSRLRTGTDLLCQMSAESGRRAAVVIVERSEPCLRMSSPTAWKSPASRAPPTSSAPFRTCACRRRPARRPRSASVPSHVDGQRLPPMGSRTVKIRGAEVMLKSSSNYKKCMGDEAATKTLGMGVVTHCIGGKDVPRRVVVGRQDRRGERRPQPRYHQLERPEHDQPDGLAKHGHVEAPRRGEVCRRSGCGGRRDHPYKAANKVLQVRGSNPMHHPRTPVSRTRAVTEASRHFPITSWKRRLAFASTTPRTPKLSTARKPRRKTR